MRFILGVIVLIVLSFNSANSQSGSSLGSAFEGKNFLLGFMQNEIDEQDPLLLQIIIVSSYPAEVVVNIPGESSRYYSLKADSIQKIDVISTLEIEEVERPVKKAIEISSTVPILVYTFNSRPRSSDCFTAVPVTQWGKEYVIMSFPNDQYWETYKRTPLPEYLIPRKSEFLVLAGEDNTRVTIIPKPMTNSKRSQNVPFDVILQRGDAYLVQSYDYQMGQGDLTGSIVRSDKPIGVISGHMRTAVPQFMDYNNESKDHLAEMLTPTNVWARQFYSSPYGFHSGGDLFKITNIHDSTIVTVESKDTSYILYLDKPGAFATIPAVKNATKWTSNHPIQIGQFMMRTTLEDDNNFYDPCMVLLPPAEQFVSKMIFQTVGNEPINPEQYIGYGINLIVEEVSIPSLKLDDEFVVDLDIEIWNNTFQNSNHRWVQLPVSSGKHVISCDTGGFSGIAFGYGFADSYAVILGSSLSNPYSNDSLAPILSINELCSDISGTISEVVNDSSSGLLFVYMSDRSYNFQCEITPKLFYDVDTVHFNAKPIDPLQNGRFILEFRDKNGNGDKYEFLHYGIGLNTRDSINFREVQKGDSVCYLISNLSNGNLPVHLDSVKFAEPVDKRLYMYENQKPPILLKNGESYDFNLCFVPNNDFSKLNQKLYYYYDCGRYDSTIIIGSVNFPELTVFGYDFGDICLGDSADGVIKIFNRGNVTITIESIYEIQIDNQFSIDTLDSTLGSIFPITIQKEDSLFIKAHFKPNSIGNFTNINSANNNLNLPNEIILIGSGIAPLVESIRIDWGKRRIGTTNDTSFYLENKGKCYADISFTDFEKEDNAFEDEEIISVMKRISALDSLLIHSSYQPVNVINSELSANLIVNSPLHDLVKINLKGEGTLPVIKPIRVDFDTIYIFSSVDSLADILFNSGNERLWFDYKNSTGDDSCFKINDNDFSILKNQYLQQSEYFKVPITFNPQKEGYSEMALVINHDAYPAFNKGDTLVIISGYAKPLDIIEPEISFDSDIRYLPCNDNLFNFKLTNNGNFDLRLDSLELITTDIDAQWLIPPVLPLTITPEGFKDYKMSIKPRADRNGYIQLKAVFNDTIYYFSENVLIEDKMYPIEINNPGTLEFNIGDEVMLPVSGKFPHGSEFPVGFEFDINMDAEYLYLLENNTVLKVISNGDTVEYFMELSQSNSKIKGKVFDQITIIDSSTWFFEIKLLALLAEERNTQLGIKVQSDICFSPGELILNSHFYGVCLFDIRKVIFQKKNQPTVFLYPNPVTDELCIKINLLHDSWLNLSIFDQNGKKNALYENFNLKKGLHSLIFEISPMASGIYMLSAMTENGVENIMFIINK